MQDLDPLVNGAESVVASLLIDSPGAQTLEQNRDLFVKRRRVRVLGRSAAAMALYTLNAFAPAGGAGIRTSLRGGGPFTCLVSPDVADGRPLPLLGRAASAVDAGDGLTPLARGWCDHLAGRANRVFDATCPLDPSAPRGIGVVVRAKKRLSGGLRGCGKDGQDVFKALGLPPPETGGKAASKGRKRSI